MTGFKSLKLPPANDDLDAYVKERGVPVLASPPEGQEDVAVNAVPQAPRPAPNKKMAIEVPVYLPAQLRQLALQKDCTIRYLILSALHQAGCKIAPEDLQKDGRRQLDS